MLEVLGFAVLLAIGPYQTGDIETSLKSLQEAQAKKDPELVKRLAAETCALARHQITDAEPADADEKAAWKERVAYARDVELQTEYVLLATALVGPAAVTVDLMAALEQQNPKSRYLEQGYTRYVQALNQTGAAAKIPAVAEKGLANLPNQEDLLAVMIEYSYGHKQSDRALTYARRLIAAMEKRPKPEGIAAADWERKRTASLSSGYWYAGIICGEKNLYVESNRDLRAALPLIKGNDAMMGPALFYLGVVNFQLGRQTLNKKQVLEAVTSSQQAAKYTGPYTEQAWKNAMLIKTEADRMR
jgi:hypothetical protein